MAPKGAVKKYPSVGTAEAMPRYEPRLLSKGQSRALGFSNHWLLLQDWVVSIGDQVGTHTFGVFDVGIGADLHAKEFIDGRIVG